MKRLASLLLLIGTVSLVGCGSSSSPTAETNTAATTAALSAPAAPSPTSAPAAIPSPSDVVSQFLDEIRRGGGEDTVANELLTQRARSELKRIGQSVQPIGSPDASFEVTRFEKVPGDPNSALVHSLWREPNADGTSGQFQVVWAVHLEPAGWRISGLAMELSPNDPPMVIDFENGDLMAKLLSPPVEQASNSSQASEADATISR